MKKNKDKISTYRFVMGKVDGRLTANEELGADEG